MSGWRDKPGVPMNPERDGAHWVGNVVREWLAEFQMWQDRHGYCVKPETWGVLPYGGPCLTPAELAAREAAAFKRGQEAMRQAVERKANEPMTVTGPIKGPDGIRRVREAFIAAIRALPVDEMPT